MDSLCVFLQYIFPPRGGGGGGNMCDHYRPVDFIESCH